MKLQPVRHDIREKGAHRPPLPVVAIVDYQMLFGETLAELMGQDGSLVAHYAPSPELAIQGGDDRPAVDVVLMRLGPEAGHGSLSLLRAINACRGARVILHDDHLMGCNIETALICGVSGIIAADTPPKSLAAIVALVAQGETYVPPYFIRQSLDRILGRRSDPTDTPDQGDAR